LRQLTFFSFAECNEVIALVMQRMNDHPMRNLGLSRRELFEKIERDALIACPPIGRDARRRFSARAN